MSGNVRRLAGGVLAAASVSVLCAGCAGLGGTAAKTIVAVVTAEITEELLSDDAPPASPATPAAPVPAKPAAPARPAVKSLVERFAEQEQARRQKRPHQLQARFAEGDAERFAKCRATTTEAGFVLVVEFMGTSPECRVFAEKLLEREERAQNGPFSDGDEARWRECMDERASVFTRKRGACGLFHALRGEPVFEPLDERGMDAALSRLHGHSLSAQVESEEERDEFLLRLAERKGELRDCDVSSRRVVAKRWKLSNLEKARLDDAERRRSRDCYRHVEAKYPDVDARWRLDENFRKYRRAWAECLGPFRRFRKTWGAGERACRLRLNAEYPGVVARINEWLANSEGD